MLCDRVVDETVEPDSDGVVGRCVGERDEERGVVDAFEDGDASRPQPKSAVRSVSIASLRWSWSAPWTGRSKIRAKPTDSGSRELGVHERRPTAPRCTSQRIVFSAITGYGCTERVVVTSVDGIDSGSGSCATLE